MSQSSDRRRAARNRYRRMEPEHLAALVKANLARVYEGSLLLRERDHVCPLPLALFKQIETFVQLFEDDK